MSIRYLQVNDNFQLIKPQQTYTICLFILNCFFYFQILMARSFHKVKVTVRSCFAILRPIILPVTCDKYLKGPQKGILPFFYKA